MDEFKYAHILGSISARKRTLSMGQKKKWGE